MNFDTDQQEQAFWLATVLARELNRPVRLEQAFSAWHAYSESQDEVWSDMPKNPQRLARLCQPYLPEEVS
jgi:hypothetical protein